MVGFVVGTDTIEFPSVKSISSSQYLELIFLFFLWPELVIYLKKKINEDLNWLDLDSSVLYEQKF